MVQDADFTIRFETDSVNADVSYAGKAPAGSSNSEAKWQIKKIDETSGIAITYANGNTNFNNIFDNRENLTYL